MAITQSSEIKHRFNYHPPTAEKVLEHSTLREVCEELAHHINEFLPDGREKAVALTKVEEVMFWGNAAIARS